MPETSCLLFFLTELLPANAISAPASSLTMATPDIVHQALGSVTSAPYVVYHRRSLSQGPPDQRFEEFQGTHPMKDQPALVMEHTSWAWTSYLAMAALCRAFAQSAYDGEPCPRSSTNHGSMCCSGGVPAHHDTAQNGALLRALQPPAVPVSWRGLQDTAWRHTACISALRLRHTPHQTLETQEAAPLLRG